VNSARYTVLKDIWDVVPHTQRCEHTRTCAPKHSVQALTCFLLLPAAAQVTHDAFELLGEGQLGLLLDLEGLLGALAFNAGRALYVSQHKLLTMNMSQHVRPELKWTWNALCCVLNNYESPCPQREKQ
jgi:hypothetical protein